MKLWIIRLLGIIVHFMLMINVNDIRKTAELFRGYWINCTNQAIAQRLVLIVPDGFDVKELSSINQNNLSCINKIKQSGIWGTAVGNNLKDTSGIKAISSGFEEQPELFSNIYKGENREYDHIFNYATKVYYFGDENLLNQFELGSKDWSKSLFEPKRSNVSKEHSVVNKIQNAFHNEGSKNDLRIGKVIIFVHLPLNRLQVNKDTQIMGSLDKFLQNVTDVIDKIFQDKRTIYLLCSDLVEVKKENNKSKALFLMWGQSVKKTSNVTINITDISPLVSGILGNPIPLNSVGKWHAGFFKIAPSEEAKAKACNALHLASVAKTVQQQVGNKMLKNLGLSHTNIEETLEKNEKQLSVLLSTGRYTKAISESSDLLEKLSMQIIKKDTLLIRRLLNLLMHLTYVGWSFLLLTKMVSLSISRDVALKHEIKLLRRKTELWFFGLHTVLMLLGGLSILFVVIQSWPIYYVMYCLPMLIIWGSVINNIQNWIGFINKLHRRKSILIFLYVIIYGITVEAYYWGLYYSYVLAVHVGCVCLYNTAISFFNREYTGIKISMILGAILLISSIYVPLDNLKLSPPFLISSALVWSIMGIVSAFYMWISGEIMDSIVMIAALTHYSTSLVLIIIAIFYQHQISPLILIILLILGYLIPIFGKAVIPACEVPLDVNKYRKSNRLQHVGLCTSSIILFFSVTFEPFFVFILFAFSLMWIFLTEPKIKVESINYKNAHYALTFTMFIILVQCVVGIFEMPEEIPYIIKYSLPSNDFTIQIFEKIKMYLPIFIVQFMFTSLSLSSGGESQLLLAMFVQNSCGYRLFLGMEEFNKYKNHDKDMIAHISLQTIMLFQLLARPLILVLLHASVLKVCRIFRSAAGGMRNVITR